jgi:hypothetical protein
MCSMLASARNTLGLAFADGSQNPRLTHSSSSNTVTESNYVSASAAAAAGRCVAACASSGSSTKNRARTFVSTAAMACRVANG